MRPAYLLRFVIAPGKPMAAADPPALLELDYAAIEAAAKRDHAGLRLLIPLVERMARRTNHNAEVHPDAMLGMRRIQFRCSGHISRSVVRHRNLGPRRIWNMPGLRKWSLAGLIWLLVASGCGDNRPTRSDCIVGFGVDWSKVETDRRAVRNSLGLRPIGGTRPLSGMAISRDGKQLYLQFKQDCDRKAELAAALIAIWKSEGLDLPMFVRLPEPILPSTQTIDLQGPHWRDGPPQQSQE